MYFFFLFSETDKSEFIFYTKCARWAETALELV